MLVESVKELIWCIAVSHENAGACRKVRFSICTSEMGDQTVQPVNEQLLLAVVCEFAAVGFDEVSVLY